MDKIVDYIKWMGGFDFEQYPFREADALVLCVAAYYDMDPVFDAAKPACSDGEKPADADTPSPADGDAHRSPVFLSDCIPMIEEGKARLMITGGDMGNGEVFEAAARSRRFGRLAMRDYADLIDRESDLQFSAVTFDYDPDNYMDEDAPRTAAPFSFIAFRGTDSTLTGWKEDFMISFTRPKAQELAAEYAQKEIQTGIPGHKWYIGGHSKGGNLAMYAGCMLSDAALDHVERIFNLDGPGFCPEVLDLSLLKRIDPKTTRIIPEFDVFGKIFEPDITDTRIVCSYRKGLDQHSLPSWLVEYGELSKAKGIDIRAKWLGDNLSGWISAIPHKNRQVFIDELFDALQAGGAESLDEVKAENLRDAMTALSKTSKLTKYALTSLPERLLQAESLSELSSDIRNEIRQSIKTEAEKIKLPEVRLPEVKLPDVKLPEVKLPEMITTLIPRKKDHEDDQDQ